MRMPFASWLSTPWPSVALEIAASRVTGVVVRSGSGSVRAHATRSLADGVVEPSLTAKNVMDPAALTQAVSDVLGELGVRPRQIGLVVPDLTAKVSLVSFDTVPDRAEDLRGLIGWQMQKSAPFALDAAQLSYCAGQTTDDGAREFVVVLSRRDIVEQYERPCRDAGIQPAVVDLSTFNLINLALATQSRSAPSDDWLLVHVERGSTTIAIVRGNHLAFFRNGHTSDSGDLANFVHQTTMYHEDRLGGRSLDRAVVAGAGSDQNVLGALREALAAGGVAEITPITPHGAVTLKDSAPLGQDVLDAVASPIGLLVRQTAA